MGQDWASDELLLITNTKAINKNIDVLGILMEVFIFKLLK